MYQASESRYQHGGNTAYQSCCPTGGIISIATHTMANFADKMMWRELTGKQKKGLEKKSEELKNTFDNNTPKNYRI